VTVEKSTNQMQAFHEPPSRRPHCSSTQQWVTPELGLSSTPGQGIQTQAEVTGNSVTHNHQEECSPRNLPRSLPTDPHSPHACSTPGECTFSVTWTVLRLPVSLTLGYRNRPDRKSRVLWQLQGSFQELSPSSAHSLTWRESLTGQQASRSPELRATTNTGKMDTGFPRTGSAVTGCSLGQDFRIGLHAQARSAFPGQTETLPRN
jgi:hypothetical protein